MKLPVPDATLTARHSHSVRWTRLVTLFGICAVAASACKPKQGTPQPLTAVVGHLAGDPANVILVNVTSLRSDSGTVRCLLYNHPDGFPEGQTHVIARAVALPKSRSAQCRFEGMDASHDYSVVLHHDENNDNVFQKNTFGMPLEGYGFSNNAVPTFSAPSWNDCKFSYTSGEKSLALGMQY